jgi:hypothetical protein
MSSDINPYERRHMDRRRLPPLPVNRLTEHLEEDLAYRVEFTIDRAVQMTGRASDGLSELHEENANRSIGDPLLGQLLYRLEATYAIACENAIADYINHVKEDRDNKHRRRY